jgi:hypothetical protein
MIRQESKPRKTKQRNEHGLTTKICNKETTFYYFKNNITQYENMIPNVNLKGVYSSTKTRLLYLPFSILENISNFIQYHVMSSK